MSILKKISLLFLISLVLMGVIGSWIDNINSKRIDNLIKEKYLTLLEDIFKKIENKTYINNLFKKNHLEVLNNYEKDK
jgi:two-component system OmpR family sensor kinase